MLFSEFSHYLQKLEATAGRNQMTEILAVMFAKVLPEEAKYVAYLLQGNLGPAYKAPDFGVADKMVIKALGKEAEKLFKEKGDLGLVAEQWGKAASRLSVIDVHQRLMAVATTEGAGSQEKKQQLIISLLGDLDKLGARYATRIILGKLRTGFSDMTVLDALSWFTSGDKSKREAIEQMYNVRADLGEIMTEIIKHKLPRRIDPELGTPILMAKAERAANFEEIWERNGVCAVEHKLDGLRVQAHIKNHQVTLFSRGLENVTFMYPDIVVGLQKQITSDSIVEGEMIAVNNQGQTLEFKKTMNRKRKHGIGDKALEIPMAIFLFDVLLVQNKVVMHESNKDRWAILQKLIAGQGNVKLIPRIVAKSVAEMQQFFEEAITSGTEGIVAKKLDAPYTPGSRDFGWIKMKTVLDSVDVVVMGYSVGEGKRTEFGIGEFLVGVYDPKTDKFLTVSKVGSGATDKEWVKLKTELDKLKLAARPERYEVSKQYEQDFWVKPHLVLEIVASEISISPAHTSGFGLRFPRLISWREKKPEDATTVNEIKTMYTNLKKAGDN